MFKKIKIGLLSILVIVLTVVIGYVIYAYTSYYRLEDRLVQSVQNNQVQQLETNKDYKLTSFNIGYGAYTQDYSFFMDGGKSSRAYNKNAVHANISGVMKTIDQINPDLVVFQEVDQDGDRSQHVNEVALLQNHFNQYANVFTQNYDSPYLFYPFTLPIGKAVSGLVTLSKFQITNSMRYSLPIETNFNKFLDLDRAFTANHLPLKNGKFLTLINVHLSAYTKDRDVQQAQFETLFNYMASEQTKGNYVIVAGDYNHDVLLGKSNEIFNNNQPTQSWTHPFPVDELPEGFQLVQQDLVKNKIPSARALDEGYQKGHTLVTIIDGFIVSKQVKVDSLNITDLNFLYSDHHPVTLTFQLVE